MIPWDDVVAGQTLACGSHTITKDEIVRFAQEFDPQPFHLDEAAAAKTVFGGPLASGWHTASLCRPCPSLRDGEPDGGGRDDDGGVGDPGASGQRGMTSSS